MNSVERTLNGSHSRALAEFQEYMYKSLDQLYIFSLFLVDSSLRLTLAE